MALGFFYRNQKIVLGIMVLLMVAFLIPTTIQSCGQRDTGKQVIGHAAGRKLTLRMVQSAGWEMDLLQRHLKLAYVPVFRAIWQSPNGPLAWLLLANEAEDLGVRVSDDEIQTIVTALRPQAGGYQHLLAELRDSNATEKQFRQAVGRFMMILKAFELSQTAEPPALGQVRHLARDLREQVEAKVVVLAARDFVAKAPEPTEAEVLEMFRAHKEVLADDPATNRTEFGFGYRVPDQADVEYLLIDREAVSRAVSPSEQEMIDYWRQNQGKLKRRVEMPAATEPAASAPATAPAAFGPTTSAPAVEVKEVVLTSYAQARPQIVDILRDEAAEAKMVQVVAQARRLIRAEGAAAPSYAQVAQAMVTPADETLERKMPAGRLPVGEISLGSLLEYLDRSYGVRIVYPVDMDDDDAPKSDAKVVVGEDWQGLSLGKVLEKTGEAVALTGVKWMTCRGFADTIFPSAPVDLSPLVAGRTGMVSLDKLAKNPVLQFSLLDETPQLGEDRSVAWVVRTAEEFGGRENLIAKGKDFPQAMFVLGAHAGRLLWRLADAQRSHSLETNYPPADVRPQVVEDVKISKAFRLAAEAAKALAEAAGDDPAKLEELAKAAEYKVTETGPLTRLWWDRESGRLFPSYVPGVGVNPSVLEAAFAGLDSSGAETQPASQGSARAQVVPIPRNKEVVVLCRTAHRPATAEDFAMWRPLVSAILMQQRAAWEQVAWFSWSIKRPGKPEIGIARRVGYEPIRRDLEEPTEGSEQAPGPIDDVDSEID